MHAPHRTRKASSSQTVALLALLGANIALAFGPWFVRLADTGPVATGFWRITLATPVLVGLALGGGGWRPVGLGRTLVVMIVFAGVCFAADLGSWHLGIVKTTLANATLFGNSAVLLYPLYGFIAARAWPSRTQSVALLLALIGAALLMGRSFELNPAHLTGDLLCLLAGLFYTIYLICMAQARTTMPPAAALALSSLASIVPLLLFTQAMGERLWPHDWAPLIGVALLSQVVGQGLTIYALGRFSPLVVGIALLSQPIVAGTVGWIVYGERLGLPDLIGAALVAVALVLVRRGRVAPNDSGEQ
jgi:drug/metabolite transporter (DMT)-like permease